MKVLSLVIALSVVVCGFLILKKDDSSARKELFQSFDFQMNIGKIHYPDSSDEMDPKARTAV